jgi:hypothetical protein
MDIISHMQLQHLQGEVTMGNNVSERVPSSKVPKFF